MNLIALAIHDNAAEAYLSPFFAPNIGLAKRMFVEAVSNPESKFNIHAKDFTLFHIGSFDTSTGLLEHQVPMSLGNAIEAKSALENHLALSEEK